MHSSIRRALLSVLFASALLAPAAWAQPFPNRPLKLIVPFAAGGSAGLTGVDAAAKSAPDGYTICLAGAAALSAIPFMLSKMPFDWQKDLALLTLVVRVPEVLTVQPALGLNTFADFVAHARANPGKINFGSAGAGSIT